MHEKVLTFTYISSTILSIEKERNRKSGRVKNMYKYIVENWLTEETIKVFDSEEERQEWLNDNCISFSDGNYIDGTDIKISIYESRYNY